jgi:hypothetical protein
MRFAPAALLALAACTPTETASYSPPEASGLIAVRAFPGPDDVCQVIGENALTNQYLDDSATLIGCPKAERGAIRDRQSAGAQVVGEAGEWLLLSVPGG